jgi:hypothetical protein
MLEDNPDTEDLIDHIGNYQRVLDQLDQTLPPDFVLYDVIRRYDKEGRFTAFLPEHAAAAPTAATGDKDDPRAAPPRPPVPADTGAAPAADDPRTAAPQPPVPPTP